jgi:hypothetical protein
MSAVLAVRRKEIWQGLVRAFNVWLAGSTGNGAMGLQNQGAHSADTTMDDNASPRRVIVVAVDLGAGHE